MTLDLAPFLSCCVSVDLEVDPKSARLFAFAAVRGEGVVLHKGGALEPALDRLEAFCEGAVHLVGHNILRHDLPHLVANRARLAALGAAPVDTLWLNPLAVPRNPYHHLVKHYQDGRLQAGHVNDPELDARLALEVLADQIAAFARLGQEVPDALTAYHHLTTRGEAACGFDALFRALRGPAPDAGTTHGTIRRLLAGRACNHRLEQTLGRLADPRNGWPMAYALSWISVAGGDSVMPPWVRLQFPQAGLIVRHLRDTNCGDPSCGWCAEKNNPNAALERWFGFPAFRPQPVDEMGRPLQERIVAEAMAGKSVLGILPTGTGKSVCYQIPALSRFDKTGALTVVISPLVALMADQVQGLARAGISSAVTVNGMLSLPERHDALEKVRMGDAAMLLISPEQLRSPSIRTVLQQREVGLWVLDEAHCVSKWGHDFRPDYRYVSRFIKEFSGDSVPPVLCLTATAKPDVAQGQPKHIVRAAGTVLASGCTHGRPAQAGRAGAAGASVGHGREGHLRGRGCLRIDCAAAHHLAHDGIKGETVSIVNVFIARQPPIDRLSKKPLKPVNGVLALAVVIERTRRKIRQPEHVIQLAHHQKTPSELSCALRNSSRTRRSKPSRRSPVSPAPSG